jgi:hypothetical protein
MLFELPRPGRVDPATDMSGPGYRATLLPKIRDRYLGI